MTSTQTRLFDIMSHPVYSVDEKTTVFEALELTQARGIHHLPVLAGEDLVGFVCTCDLRDGRVDDPVRAVMKTTVATLESSELPAAAAKLMRDRGVGSVVVTQDGKPCGIVTREHLAAHGVDLADIVETCRCSCCGQQQHLRLRPDGSYLCVDCLERSVSDPHFDLGTSD